MRKINRNNIPDELHQDLLRRQSHALSTVTPNIDRDWRIFSRSQSKKAILGYLAEMHNNKCCYCEVLLDSQSFPTIEHHYPKGRYGERCFQYHNFFLACSRCNTNKGDRFDENLLSPTEDVPEDHLFFPVDFEIEAKTSRGELTANEILRLNNDELKKTRARYLETALGFMSDINELLQADRPNKKFILRKTKELIKLTESNSPFSLMIKGQFETILISLLERFQAENSSIEPTTQGGLLS